MTSERVLKALALEAVKSLTPKQRQIWEYASLEKLTQDQIAKKLGVSQPSVFKHLKVAKKSIQEWGRMYKVVLAIVKEHQNNEEDIGPLNGERELYSLQHKTPPRSVSEDGGWWLRENQGWEK
jgi:DNA-binding CsgD family transcriptional regulator